MLNHFEIQKHCLTRYICATKTGLITHDRKFNFFGTDTKIHQYAIKFHYQNEAVLSVLVLLAAFS